MKMYIDLFFIFNVIMDYIIIMSTSILLKRRTSYIRMILSSLIGGISSLVLFTSFNKIVIEIISIVIMVFISFGYKGIRYLLKNILYMYILSTLLGGIIYLFNIKVSNSMFLTYLIIIVISIEIMILYIKENKKMRNIYNNYYKVDIYFKDREKLSLIGFIDTGNNLYDPYKKRPVIIVPNKYIKEDKYILVPYHTINGNGLLKCIKPDIIFIDGIGYKGNVLIGFSDSFNFGDGVDEEKYVNMFLNGDMKARDKLIEHNLRLVVFLAKKYENTKIDLEDLVSIGTIGLIKGVNTYQNDKNIKLATYASRCIDNEILMYLRKTKKKRTEVSFEDSLSFDSEGNELHLEDVLGTDDNIVTKPIEDELDKKLMYKEVSKLGKRDKEIIELRYGLNGKKEMTQKEVANMLGISQSYISRIEKKVIKKLSSIIKL